jgi:hypothetical protein
VIDLNIWTEHNRDYVEHDIQSICGFVFLKNDLDYFV